MAEASLQIIAKLPFLPADDKNVAQNTFFFHTTNGDLASLATYWAPKIIEFYNDGIDTEAPIASYLSPTIVRDECSLEFRSVNFETGVIGTLLNEQIFTLEDIVGDAPSLPNEVAFVLTIGTKETSATTLQKARRRGRLYLGPLCADAMTAQNNVAAVPNASFMEAVVGAGERLAEWSWGVGAQSGIEADGQWVVWSRTGETYGSVNGGWVDNAWDSQRRRGTEPTAKTTWKIASATFPVP